MMTVRVRFAPSPTGELHVGSARTALFNWLFARHHRGTYILRFEDTDVERNRPELIEPILDGFRWLGIVWDEGPFFQSQRMELYGEYAGRLLKAEKAYYCFCSPEELEAKRRAAMQRKLKPKYDGHCRQMTPEQQRALLAEDRRPALRLRVPASGSTVVHDVIRGEVSFDNTELDDFIILRSDGRPTYNFAVVVDDVTMQITHVIRADEHLNNTPKQVLLYRALDYPLPQFAHVPMVLAKDRSKLSKRHGATSVSEYRDRGILPEALVNYLVRLGWAHGDQEIFSVPELIEKFSLEAIHPSAAVFDEEKLLWLNHHYIKTGDLNRIGELLREFLVQRDDMSESAARGVPNETFARIVDLCKERCRTLAELAEVTHYILANDLTYEADAAKKHLTPENISLLQDLAGELAKTSSFKAPELEVAARAYVESRGKTLRDIAQACRVAITGKVAGAGLFETMEIIGRDKVIARLRRVAGG